MTEVIYSLLLLLVLTFICQLLEMALSAVVPCVWIILPDDIHCNTLVDVEIY